MTYTWPLGVERRVVQEVDSTNAFVRNLGRNGQGPIWVLAHNQSKSRGRRGRAWSFQPGNFAASYLMWPSNPIHEIAQMSFVAALALFDTLAELGAKGIALKWPNDLLVGGEKISGILLETVEHHKRTGLVIGIGVNLKHLPDKAEIEERALPATSLAVHIGQTVAPDAFLDLLAPFLSVWQTKWEKDGFGPVRQAWLARAAGLGSPITARLPNTEYQGIFEDIDENGSLVLRTNRTVMNLPAADIYFSGAL